MQSFAVGMHSALLQCITSLTMGLSKKGNPCIVLMASPADLMSANTTHACPLNL